MKITILNGSPEPSAFEGTLGQIKNVLEAQNHSVTLIDLRHLSLRYCIGCWGCWVKTPGQCTAQDASIEIDQAVINSDFTLWAAPLKMGFPSALLKMALDKHIPLIHPYMEVVHNEAHHLKRYHRYPRVGLLVGKEENTDEADLGIVTDIFSRTALNLKSCLEFSLTTTTSVEEIAQRITDLHPTYLPLPKRLPATTGGSRASAPCSAGRRARSAAEHRARDLSID